MSDPPNVDERDPAKNRADRRLRQGGRACHVVDVRDAPGAANRDVEKRGCDATGQHSPFERARGRGIMWRIENALVDQRLDRQSRRRKHELFPWLELRVDSGVDRRATLIQPERGPATYDVRSDDVRALVCKYARCETAREGSPPTAPAPGAAPGAVCRLLCGG